MSYLRLVRFTFSDGNQSKAQAMADDLIPAIKQQPGCLSAVYFGGGTDGQSGLCVHWDSQEHADSAAPVISPRLMQHLSGNINGQADIGLFPVIAS